MPGARVQQQQQQSNTMCCKPPVPAKEISPSLFVFFPPLVWWCFCQCDTLAVHPPLLHLCQTREILHSHQRPRFVCGRRPSHQLKTKRRLHHLQTQVADTPKEELLLQSAFSLKSKSHLKRCANVTFKRRSANSQLMPPYYSFGLFSFAFHPPTL